MTLHVCNDEEYGFAPLPPQPRIPMQEEIENFVHLKLEAIINDTPLPLDRDMESYVHYPSVNIGVDAVYVINLEKRPMRLRLMQLSLKELGLKFTVFKAIDAK